MARSQTLVRDRELRQGQDHPGRHDCVAADECRAVVQRAVGRKDAQQQLRRDPRVDASTLLRAVLLQPDIALERDVGLEEYSAEQGTRINARVSAELLLSIFSPYGPLHDGATLISGDTIMAAGVILPLTQFPVSDKSLGTRHRAALGLSEETDALVVVVSEETAQISLAHRGRLERGIDPARLREVLAGSGSAVQSRVEGVTR